MNGFKRNVSQVGKLGDGTICEAVGCSAKATDEIAVNVGDLGAILVVLCSDCIPKFQEFTTQK